MSIESQIEDALKTLVSDGTFSIEEIVYAEKVFGNIFVHLKSRGQIDIRFISDRGAFLCQIGCCGEWHFIEDVFQVIGIKYNMPIKNNMLNSQEFVDMVADVSPVIKNNIAQIFQAFDAQHYKCTHEKLELIESDRARKMFNL